MILFYEKYNETSRHAMSLNQFGFIFKDKDHQSDEKYWKLMSAASERDPNGESS